MKKLIVGLLAALILSGVAYAFSSANPRYLEIVEFNSSHWHDGNGTTHEAPQHSGGTDKYGCHNASVPYHCH